MATSQRSRGGRPAGADSSRRSSPRRPFGVANDDDLVDRLAIELGQDGLERGQVAVDVADGRDAHGARLSGDRLQRQARPRADEVESRAVGAGELARGRHERTRANPCNRGRELGFELREVGG